MVVLASATLPNLGLDPTSIIVGMLAGIPLWMSAGLGCAAIFWAVHKGWQVFRTIQNVRIHRALKRDADWFMTHDFEDEAKILRRRARHHYLHNLRD